MQRIKSFDIDHNKLEPGLYVSRIDDDIVSYDVRFLKPNTPPFLTFAGIHTLEHLLATYLRNTQDKDKIVYVGPMGCRTGFYILTRDSLSQPKFIELIKQAMYWVSQFNGEIPGTTAIECGNYLEHSLEDAKKYAANYYHVIKEWHQGLLNY